MLLFFPTPYPDELLYSIISRYKKFTGESNHRTMSQDIFGNKHFTASVELPSNIGRLVERLPITSKLTVEQLIQKHTMFPLYSAFLPSDQANAVYRSMVEGNGNDIYTRSGILGSAIRPNKFIRYCKVCFSRDLETYGELYWHRKHQVPGLDVCVEHGISLLDSEIRFHADNKYKFIAADEQTCLLDDVTRETPLNEIEKYQPLNNNIKMLLNNKFPNRSFEWFQQYYWDKLKEHGYASIFGHKVDQDRLYRNFISYYGEIFLERTQSAIHKKNNWLKQITRGHQRSFHPIRHLLLLQFFNSNVEEIFSWSEPCKPFGHGPWVCMNLAANHYKKLIVNHVKLTVKEKEPIGTFSCLCGFIYTQRTGDDAKISVKQFGMVWVEECKRLAGAGKSLKEISRILHSSPRTVKKYLCIEEGEEDGNVLFGQEKQRSDDHIEWKIMQSKHPYLSRTELRELNPTLFNRLYRTERSWLEQESPKKKAGGATNKRTRVDWQYRDQELVVKVKNAVVTIQNIEGKPKQISKRAIGYEIGHRTVLEKQIHKLPLTKACLDQLVENDEQYRMRKVCWAIEILKNEGKRFSKWDVLRKAGIRPENANNIIETMVKESQGKEV
jgi:hypothetical protein